VYALFCLAFACVASSLECRRCVVFMLQVEIITHVGPHRRLWMGPQFTFKTFPAEGANALSSSSPVLLSDCPESQAAVVDMDTDLKSLWCVALPYGIFKPKFPYANFATFIETSLQGKLRTQIMKVHDTNHVMDFRDLCLRQSSRTLLPTFPVYYNGLNSIRVTQAGLLRTCHGGFCRKHLNMSRWLVSATFVICVGDFHRNFMIS